MGRRKNEDEKTLVYVLKKFRQTSPSFKQTFFKKRSENSNVIWEQTQIGSDAPSRPAAYFAPEHSPEVNIIN